MKATALVRYQDSGRIDGAAPGVLDGEFGPVLRTG